MDYTIEQEQAINLRGQDILVSAGAGAGKTRVLVSRMAGLICDEEAPIDADRFLVMTFTNAAAEELRDRITEELNERLARNPSDARLRRQVRKMKHADISTVHSFCSRMIRTHFSELGVDPAFRIGEEGELFLLRRRSMEELLEEAYGEGRPSFHALVEAYAPGQSDVPIENMVEQLYAFLRGFPDEGGWIRRTRDAFAREGSQGESLSFLYQKTRQTAEYLLKEAERTLRLFEESGEPERYRLLLEEDRALLAEIIACADYDAAYALVREAEFSALPRATKQEKACPFLENVKETHKRIRDRVLSLRDDCFTFSRKEVQEENRRLLPFLDELFLLARRFEAIYSGKKREKNVYDFDDLEHLTLQLLAESYDGEGNPQPSAVAREAAQKYRAIFVDEYQDTNLVQETILSCLCEAGKNHLFVVGDIKQSIYRFRLARPDLFLARARRCREEGAGTCIELRDNFRSSPAVLKTCNYFFSALMREEFGGVDYDETVALRPGTGGPMADDPERSECLLLMEDEELEALGADKVLAEAAVIAGRIRSLREEGVAYRDMVILLRSAAGWAEPMAQFFNAKGIPASCDAHTGYFRTREIGLLLNYLAIVDNVYQDIPMASILLSPVGKCTPEDLVRLKLLAGDGRKEEYALYDLMEWYLGEGEEKTEEGLRKKLADFLNTLKHFRKRKQEIPLHRLIWEICLQTGLYYEILLMPEGEKRVENVNLLLKKAEEYEKTVFKGLFYFLRYMEQLRTWEVELGAGAKGVREEDAVRILTIHKSKGLEFPVVFLCGLSKRFNRMDENQPVLCHPELGIGLESVDLSERLTRPSFRKRMIRMQMHQEMLEEELRILYVAMTRAKKKLILVGRTSEEAIASVRPTEFHKVWKLSASCYMDWLFPVLRKHPAFAPFLSSRGIDAACPGGEPDDFTVRILHAGEIAGEFDTEEKPEGGGTLAALMAREEMQEDTTAVRRAFSHVYPYEASIGWKRKYSVSELKKLSQTPLPDEGEEERFALPGQREEIGETRLVPAFLSEGEAAEEKPEGARRGTLVHKVMELLPFEKIRDAAGLRDAILGAQEAFPAAASLEKDRLYREIAPFFFSETGRALWEKADEKRLHRETPFTVGVPVSAVWPEASGEETIVIQGVIDAFLETEEGLILLDYKTDKIFPGEEGILLDRYRKQMLYYKIALEQILEKNVISTYIYSTSLRAYVKVPL